MDGHTITKLKRTNQPGNQMMNHTPKQTARLNPALDNMPLGCPMMLTVSGSGSSNSWILMHQATDTPTNQPAAN